MGITDIILISIGVFIAGVVCLLFVLAAIFGPVIKARRAREQQQIEELDLLLDDASRRASDIKETLKKRQNNP